MYDADDDYEKFDGDNNDHHDDVHPIAAATIAAIAAVVDFKRLIIIHSICFKNNFILACLK